MRYWLVAGWYLWQAHAFRDVVLDPMGIPPFSRVDLDSLQLHAEVDVIASRHAGGAALAHALPALNQVAFAHRDLTEMAINRLQSETVIDHDAIAVDAQRRRVHHFAVIGCDDVGMLRARKV